MFSNLNRTSDHQQSSLADYREASVMLSMNKPVLAKARALHGANDSA
jgi:hypothetical protein